MQNIRHLKWWRVELRGREANQRRANSRASFLISLDPIKLRLEARE
jgi:hypothetical protein